MKYCITIYFCLLYLVSYSQEKKNVLVLGNIDATYNDMTIMLQKMVDESAEKINIEKATKPGTLTQVITSVPGRNMYRQDRLPEGELTEAVQKLLSKKWDIVILAAKVTAILSPYEQSISTEPAIIWLDSIIKSRGGNTILYQCFPFTMPPHYPIHFTKRYADLTFFDRKLQEQFDSANSDAGVMVVNPEFNTNSKPSRSVADSVVSTYVIPSQTAQVLQAKLEIDKIAKKIGAKVLPAGYVMELCRIKHPEIFLYGAGALPTKQAAYLIACVTYKFLTGKSPINIKYKPDITVQEAKSIRELVDDVPL